jgi:hypothetical protein
MPDNTKLEVDATEANKPLCGPPKKDGTIAELKKAPAKIAALAGLFILLVVVLVTLGSDIKSSAGNLLGSMFSSSPGQSQAGGMVMITLNKGDQWKEVQVPPQHRMKFSATKNAVINIRINHGEIKTIGPGRGFADLGSDVETVEFQIEADQALETAQVGYSFERL